MINSMTGFGRASKSFCFTEQDGVLTQKDITVEMRSVNHRYMEFSLKIPRVYNYLEDSIKKHVQTKIFRGKIDVFITIVTVEGTICQVKINKELALQYVTALKNMGEYCNIEEDITVSTLSRFDDIYIVDKKNEDEQQIGKFVGEVLEFALQNFLESRQIEGERLKLDIYAKLKVIDGLLDVIVQNSEATVTNYRERLFSKLQEILQDQSIDTQRILTEAAIFAEKISTDEEVTRLNIHLKSLYDILTHEDTVPVGRKLDFLLQEVNREVNTIGSKAQNVDITTTIIEMKSELEKIREQIQNIE